MNAAATAFPTVTAAALPFDGGAFIERLGLPGTALRRAQAAAAQTGSGLGRALITLGLADESRCAAALCMQLGLSRFDDRLLPAAPVLPEQLPAAFLRRYHLIPLAADDVRVRVATADPLSDFTVKAVRLATGRAVEQVVATLAEMDAALALLYATGGPVSEVDADDAADHVRLRDMSSDAPVVRWVGQLLAQAVDRRASDVHLEPGSAGMRVRLRVDGRMVDIDPPPRPLAAAVRSRIKLLAGMDIAEFRLPQDGRIETVARGRAIDLRIATLPTVSGDEAVTIRLLDRTAVRFDFATLGFEDADVATLNGLVRGDHGIVLVTGPTGSGKTTTLYTAVSGLRDTALKVVTVEDPVEYSFDGIIQVQVHPQIGLDFASVLRSSLRHNPDVLLVGEIRDQETAQVAVQASLTGHVVLATLHTNSAVATVARLVDMRIDPFLIASTLTAVVAQRLVPLLCPHCRVPDPVAAAMLREAAPDIADPQPMRAGGCRQCGGSGTAGRAVIYEFLTVTETIAAAIAAGRGDWLPPGFRTLERHALERAARGECSFAEVMRLIRQPG